MSGIIEGHTGIGVNPFPSGFGGAINSALQDAAKFVAGITDIAADANGDRVLSRNEFQDAAVLAVNERDRALRGG